MALTKHEVPDHSAPCSLNQRWLIIVVSIPTVPAPTRSVSTSSGGRYRSMPPATPTQADDTDHAAIDTDRRAGGTACHWNQPKSCLARSRSSGMFTHVCKKTGWKLVVQILLQLLFIQVWLLSIWPIGTVADFFNGFTEPSMNRPSVHDAATPGGWKFDDTLICTPTY
jgi:hypothetical protein